MEIDSTYMCCEGSTVEGNCCENDDCGEGYMCSSYTCVSKCGDSTCDPNEDCDSCPQDCLGEGMICCSGIEYLEGTQICCDGIPYGGDCCTDNDCDEYDECVSHTCQSMTPVCGDDVCFPEEDCGCDTYCCPEDCTHEGYVCCFGDLFEGDCCGNGWCDIGYFCHEHVCTAE